MANDRDDEGPQGAVLVVEKASASCSRALLRRASELEPKFALLDSGVVGDANGACVVGVTGVCLLPVQDKFGQPIESVICHDKCIVEDQAYTLTSRGSDAKSRSFQEIIFHIGLRLRRDNRRAHGPRMGAQSHGVQRMRRCRNLERFLGLRQQSCTRVFSIQCIYARRFLSEASRYTGARNLLKLELVYCPRVGRANGLGSGTYSIFNGKVQLRMFRIIHGCLDSSKRKD